jgi:hypothetical protein
LITFSASPAATPATAAAAAKVVTQRLC